MGMATNLSSRQKSIAGLAVATAVIHVILAFLFGGSFLIMFRLLLTIVIHYLVISPFQLMPGSMLR